MQSDFYLPLDEYFFNKTTTCRHTQLCYFSKLGFTEVRHCLKMTETISSMDQLAINEDKFEPDIESDDVSELNLLDMPVEIILKISSFLDAHFLKNTLGKVCQRLEDILLDDNLWKYWIHSKIKGHYPAIQNLKILEEQPINWIDVCADMDFERNKWKNAPETVKHIVVKEMHYASVDAVLLVNKGELCVSGGRDRSMAILNVSDILASDDGSEIVYANTKLRQIREDAHTGWVWDLSPDYPDSASIVYSASWDNSVRAWDLATFECIEKFWCKMSVLSVIGCGKEVIAGLYSKKVLLFDLKSGNSPITSYKPHKGPVLGLHKHNNLIASISDDKTMAIWDRVAGKILKNDIKILNDKAYPVCISWSPLALYVGDSRGCLHLFHPEEFTYMKSHEIWEQPPIIKPSNKVVGCLQTDGTLIACTNRAEIKFMYNCYPPQEYASVNSSTVDITKLCYQNGVLCVGTCDSALEFWVPNNRI